MEDKKERHRHPLYYSVKVKLYGALMLMIFLFIYVAALKIKESWTEFIIGCNVYVVAAVSGGIGIIIFAVLFWWIYKGLK